MCGIFGIIRHKVNGIPEEHLLKETARLLHHRGPDSEGIYSEPGIAFVHTRLSLLDLNPRSNQPFWDKHRRYCLVYNGEIYNFKELQAELERDGVEFRTTSDTEVLLESIIHRGINETLQKLEGMFAFAFYDRVEKTLFLARDRFGIKPLFIYDEDDAFIFASEIQAMRPWIKFEPDQLSISSFLLGFAGPTKGHSFFKHVKFLPPGTQITIILGKKTQYQQVLTIKEIWNQSEEELLHRLKPNQIVDKVDELLFDSVRKQLIADAPVGALCSGGLDSSIIVAMASKIHNNLAIFHANVMGPQSEYDAAAILAKHLKLELNTVEVQDQDFIEKFPEVMRHFGHPFWIITSSVPFLMVSKLVRSCGVKAVLSGEGADECFLGYNFLTPDIRMAWNRPKVAFRWLAGKALRQLRIRSGLSKTFSQFVMGFSPYSSISQVELIQKNTRLPDLLMGLQNRFEVILETEDLLAGLQRNPGVSNGLSQIKSLDLMNYNLRMGLHRNDSIAMTASIEARFPFLDTEFVRLSVNLPYRMKIRFPSFNSNGSGNLVKNKWVLRKVADRYLPREISQGKKKSFNTDHYSNLKIAANFFENSFIAELFDLSSRGIKYLIEQAPHSLLLKLMHLEVWGHVCLNDLPNEDIIRKLMTHTVIRPPAG